MLNLEAIVLNTVAIFIGENCFKSSGWCDSPLEFKFTHKINAHRTNVSHSTMRYDGTLNTA
jgi:hypothetical protein